MVEGLLSTGLPRLVFMHMGFAERVIEIEDILLPMELLGLVVMQAVIVAGALTTDQRGGTV